MKKLSYLTLLLLALLAPVRADDGGNLIQNGDFSDGINHWYGGGRSSTDYASDNPMQASDPLTSKGLIIPLKAETWTKVAQDFKGTAAGGQLTITYKVSKDFAFSTKSDDYVNMPDKIGYDGWRSVDTKIGTFVLFLSDFGSSRGHYWMLSPKPVADEQKVQFNVSGMTPHEDKTITFAFPPGTGLIVITSVTFTAE
jgi:hypothetical protein